MHEVQLPNALLDYLDDLALPACVFPHPTLLGESNPTDALLPIHQNPALKSLLSEGTKKSKKRSDQQQQNGRAEEEREGEVEEAHKAKAYLRDAMSEQLRHEMVEWLTEGVRTTMAANERTTSPEPVSPTSPTSPTATAPSRHRLHRSSSAFYPSRPRIHRDRSFQLSTDVAFAKLYWRASHSGNENEGYTVLTQLPIGHFAVRSSWEEEQAQKELEEKEKANGNEKGTPAARRAGLGKRKLPPGRIMIGAHEVDAEKVRDPNSLEGMAYTLFHAPIGIFRVNSDLSITSANPSWRSICGE